MRSLSLLLILILGLPCIGKTQNNTLNQCASWLAGSYSSQMQSTKDTSYFDIRLHITPIWKSRKDGYWFYVEQALASMTEKPYRQRVYHLTQLSDGTFESAVFTLDDPLRFTGKPDSVSAHLTADSLHAREGCSVYLHWDASANSYTGGTGEKACPSDLRGASYANSHVSLFVDRLVSWDQGFDKDDKQVWGAKKGGYEFLRQKE